jgi:hypothetical protein
MCRRLLPRILAIALLVGMTAACAPRIPKEALQISPESMQQRQMQSRFFKTSDEATILAASAAVLQDLGFNLDESETDLGVLVASKQRDATEVGQVVFGVIIAGLFGTEATWDKEQKIRASLITKPSGEEDERITVRITFQRTVWDNEGDISRNESINEPEIYQKFFSKLSKSIFLEANQV